MLKMRITKHIGTCIKVILIPVTLQFFIASCEKEYSVEGIGTPPPIIITPTDSVNNDTIIVDPGVLPNCAFCVNDAEIELSTWTFRTGNSTLCGVVDTAFVLNLERSTFTFFGPSYCGADTGLIFTVTLGTVGLTSDVQNLVAASATFYYYHTNQPYILLSKADQPFNFVITSYSHITKIATGTFSGRGFRVDGRSVNVSGGKFKFRIL